MMIEKGINIIKEYLELMEHEIIKIDKDIVITYDLVEEERTENDTTYWCEDIIEMLEYKIRQDSENEEIVEQFTREINLLKKLGGLE